MKNKKALYFGWVFIMGCIMTGGLIGIYLIGKETGEYDYSLAYSVVGGTAGGFLLFLLYSKVMKKRRRNVPSFDERSLILMQRYLMIVLYALLIGSGAALITLYALGVQMIETGMLIVCLMGVYFVIGIGALITKRL
ncbi:hypothetical protein FZC79_15155 [Rossellomorea vietnamensis]|uniref:DUF2178 domain-containing protein n=1 Tax=Rossellomorea vietnamensis TaxID=218284 RepID=A0A5D4KB17_9BACI|nr:hypothetical protein [Rossellomorea vietnamensis]TYR74156.1 hypothetical protein FZC79_15155 [Rossellomorea vietnamensis]